jgi:nicotinamide/nicotinate riboside kinase
LQQFIKQNYSGLIIGIGGVSRSGKSILARQLIPYLNGKKTVILSQDDYVMAGYHAPLINGVFDWEHPGSIDFTRLRHEFFTIKPFVDNVIIEGIFAFHDQSLVEQYDRSIYLILDFQTFYIRKKMDKRWGEVPDWYISHIWRSHHKFGLPGKPENCFNWDVSTDPKMGDIFKYIGVRVHGAVGSQ